MWLLIEQIHQQFTVVLYISDSGKNCVDIWEIGSNNEIWVLDLMGGRRLNALLFGLIDVC